MKKGKFLLLRLFRLAFYQVLLNGFISVRTQDKQEFKSDWNVIMLHSMDTAG